MSDSTQDWGCTHPFDDAAKTESELLRHMRDGLMPERLDEHLLLAVWRSLYSCIRGFEDPDYPADDGLVSFWLLLLLSSVKKTRSDLSEAEWRALMQAANRALAMEITGRVAGRRGVAGADEWVLLRALEELGEARPVKAQ